MTIPGIRSSQSIRLTATVVKNLSAASGVAYMRLGAILNLLAAPNPAPNPSPLLSSIFHRSAPALGAHCPTPAAPSTTLASLCFQQSGVSPRAKLPRGRATETLTGKQNVRVAPI